MIYQGGCHCGKIRFEIGVWAEVEACNCSICAKTGFLHLTLPRNRFTLLSGRDDLTTFRFNTETAQHTFCRVCGVKPFYVPRSNPDGMDVNIRYLDSVPSHIRMESFDGKNWEQNAHRLAHKSKFSPGEAT